LRVIYDGGEVLVRPGDPDYEREYSLAVRLHEQGLPMPHADDPEDFVLVGEAARQANVARYTVHHWIKRGRLSTQLGRHGRLVSLAAVRALAAGAVRSRAAQPRPPAGPREVADDEAEYVPPSVAARQVGHRTGVVSSWAKTGKVASGPGPYGRLVRLVDVQALAAQGHTAAQSAEDAGDRASS
jgi:hypothetical protein